MASKTCLATAFALVSLFLGWLCAWGMFLQRPCHRGRDSPSPNVCGRLEGREAGQWPTSWGYYSTTVRILQGGGGITWKEGLVLACVLLQRRVRLGLHRYPARSAWRVQTLANLPPSTGAGTEQPPAPRMGNGGVGVCSPGASGPASPQSYTRSRTSIRGSGWRRSERARGPGAGCSIGTPWSRRLPSVTAHALKTSNPLAFGQVDV